MSDEMTLSEAAPEPDRPRSKRRWLLWGALGVVALVALLYAGVFIYTEVLNDPADELTTEDLAEALEQPAGSTAPSVTDAPTTTSATTDATATSAPTTAADDTTTTAAVEASVVDGHWIVTDASELGYRVGENLFGVDTEGVGRTNQVTGSLDIAGTTVTKANFEVDMASVESDDNRRDNQFRGRIMSVDEFPTSAFVLTQPIELGAIPPEGQQVDATATGDLTLRGVTQPVTFDVVAQFDGDGIGVLGQIPIVFADYGIANPSTPGVSTEDNGLLEFVLVFSR